MKIPAPSCPKPADKHTWQTLGLAQGHAPWIGCGHCHPGDRDGTGGLRSPTARPTTQHVWLRAAAFSAKTSLPNWTGLGLGGPQGASPSAACGPCLRLPPPRPNHNLQHLDSLASHGPNQTEMGRQQQGDKIEGGLNYSIFQSPQTHSGAKRTVHLMNKRNRRRKWVFTRHFNSHRRKLDGDPQHGNGGEPSPNQHS